MKRLLVIISLLFAFGPMAWAQSTTPTIYLENGNNGSRTFDENTTQVTVSAYSDESFYAQIVLNFPEGCYLRTTCGTISNCFVYLIHNEIYDENYTISDFCKIISNYAVNSAIIKLNRDEKLCCEIENNFVQNFKTVTKKETAENIVLILNDKVYQEFPKIKYGNENRGPQANEQVKAVMEILNRK